jgi:hypothetical protein
LCAPRSDRESERDNHHGQYHEEEQFSPSQIVHGEHEVVHRLFELVGDVTIPKFLKVKGEFQPFALARLDMKFELAGRAPSARQELEQVKGLEVDTSQIALMYFSHISSTVEPS